MPEIDFTSISPIIPVRDLDIALDRYRRLGFDARGYEGPERYGFADALYAEWAALKDLEGGFREPFDTPYRLREFVYVDPDGTAHRVGSPLARPRP